ncbi:MAG: cation transporter [Candidatus Hydrogenedentes bacterium]|nr:cation transporter [Candidatus Hydrogenedentota bacterium]
MSPFRPHTLDAAGRAIRLTVVGVLINVLLAAIKGIAGVLGNSYALIADAMESTMDVMKSLIVWGGLRIAATPPDEDHPYGHGKAEPMAAVVVAAGLIAGAIGLAIQSAREILTPHHLPAAFTLFVLVGVVATKETLFRVFSRLSRKLGSTALKTSAWDQRSDAITSVAAFVGIGVALIGGEGYEAADDWAALFACAVIAYNGYRLLLPAMNEIMDMAPDPAVEGLVREVASSVKGVTGLDACYVRKMGLDYYVDLHVEVRGEIPVRDGHEVAHRVKDAVRQANPRIRDVLIHIEPAGQRNSNQKAMKDTKDYFYLSADDVNEL